LFDFLAKRKNSSFPERKPSVSASGNKEFPDGNQLGFNIRKERLSGWEQIEPAGSIHLEYVIVSGAAPES